METYYLLVKYYILVYGYAQTMYRQCHVFHHIYAIERFSSVGVRIEGPRSKVV